MHRSISGKIRRPDGIRGDATTDLSPGLYRCIGRALGSLVPQAGKFLVGSDCRADSPVFLAALIEGLTASGAAVVDLGRVPTSIARYGLTRTTACACAVVSGDDAPARFNGLHWWIGEQAPCPEHFALIDAFWEECPENDIASGGGASGEEGDSQSTAGGKTPHRSPRSRSDKPARAAKAGPPPRTLDITYDYVAWLQDTWFDTPPTPLRVIVDPMHGSWAGKARRYLQAIFPRMLFQAINDTPDATFAGKTPSGTIPEQLESLSREVDYRRADVGFAFDADGGRLTLVDGHGIPLQPEKMAWFLLDSFAQSHRGEILLHDAGCSEIILDRLHREGGEPRCVPRGDAAFLSAMRTSGACFGIETGGAFYFRCLRGNMGALFTACWVLDHLATLGQQGMSLTHWRKNAPHFSITPEIRLAVPDFEALIRPLSERWKTDPHVLDHGGLRWQNADGWMLLHESHEPDTLLFRAEGRDKKSLAGLLRSSAIAIEDAGFSARDVLRAIY